MDKKSLIEMARKKYREGNLTVNRINYHYNMLDCTIYITEEDEIIRKHNIANRISFNNITPRNIKDKKKFTLQYAVSKFDKINVGAKVKIYNNKSRLKKKVIVSGTVIYKNDNLFTVKTSNYKESFTLESLIDLECEVNIKI